MDSDLLPNRAGQAEQERRDLRRECDMRADDNMALCKEIDGLRDQLAAAQSKLDAVRSLMARHDSASDGVNAIGVVNELRELLREAPKP